MAAQVPTETALKLLRMPTPDNHPFLDYPDSEARGAAYIAISNAAADLVEATGGIDEGQVFALAVLSSLTSLVSMTVDTEEVQA